MQGSKRVLVAAVVAVAGQLSMSAGVSHAANITWDGGGANSNLSNNVNWIGDILPAPADTAIFTGTVRLDPIVDVPTTYRGLTFDVNAGAFVFGGTSQLTLGTNVNGNATITNASAQTQTFNGPVGAIGGTITNTLPTGSLVFNNPFNIGFGGAASGNNVFFAGAGTTTLNAGVTGAGSTATGGAIVKDGAGTLIINAAAGASFAPGNLFRAGVVRVGVEGALGTGVTTIATAGGTLELQNSINFTHAIVNQGRANNAVPHIRNFSGNNTITNLTATNLGGFQNIESAAGNLTISNYVINSLVPSARTFSLSGAGNGLISGWSPFNAALAHNVEKFGTGTWTLGAALATNGRLGNVTANNGTLVLDGGLGTVVGGSTLVANGGTLRVVSPNGLDGEVGNATPATTLTVQQGGTLDASSFTAYSMQAGQTLVGAGTITTGGVFNAFGDNSIFVGNTTAANSVGTLAFNGSLSLSSEASNGTSGIRFDLANATTIGGGVNDLISIAGDLQVATPAGAIKILVNPITGALATGTYRLFDYTSGTTIDPSSFAVSGVSSGASRQTFSIGTATNQVNLVVSGAAANLVWKGDGAANVWDVNATFNFLNGATPDKFFQFDNVTFNDTTANTTVNVSVPVNPSTLTVSSNQNYTFNGAGSITTVNGLTKSGTGTLTIANTGPNVLTGGVTISAGTLQVGIGGAEGSIGNVAVANNGTLILNNSVAPTTGIISGTGNLIVRGGGANLLVANTYTGATSLESGVTILGNAAGLGDVATGTTISSGAQLYSTVQQTIAEPITLSGDGPTLAAGALRLGGATTSTFTGPVTLAGNTTINADGNATGRFNSTLAGTGTLTKEGGGLVILTDAGSTWTGGTVINTGTLQLGAGAVAVDLPAGTLTLGAAGTLSFGSNQALTFSRDVTGAGTIAQAFGGGTTTLTGNLTGFTGTLSVLPAPAQPLLFPTTVGGTLIVAVPTGATIARVSDTNGSNSSVLRLTNSNAIASGALIDIGAQQATGTGRLELGNNVAITAGAINIAQRNLFAGQTISDLTPSILSTDGSNTLTGNITAQTGGTYIGLSSAAGSTFTVNGTVVPVATAGSPRNLALMGAGTGILNSAVTNNTQAINVVKIGSGTWTATGANTYSGSTTVVAGTLVLGVDAQQPVFGGAGVASPLGVDVQGGKVAFAYVGSGAALSTAVGAALDAGFDQTPAKFATGTIRSTTLAAGRILGWIDRVDLSRVEVAYTLPGDSNLDFAVNFDDLLALAQAYDASGGATPTKVYAQGDSNYDGFVNFDDLLVLAQNYNLSLSVEQSSLLGSSFAADYALALSQVPEPTSLAVVGGLSTLLLGRRRRA